MGTILQHRWSGFNNPIIWAAAGIDDIPGILIWLGSVLDAYPGVMHGVSGAVTSETIRQVFPDLRQAL
eukprot:4568728-Pyramimonas_sp.AAC.1